MNDNEESRPYLHTQPGFPAAPVADPRLDKGRGTRLLLRLALACCVLAALAAAAAAGWIRHRDRQMVARLAPQPADDAGAGGAALDALLNECPPVPDGLRAEIVDNATLVHQDSSGDWGSGHRETRLYRHHYFDYYAEYSTGFFPVQRRFCRID